MWVAWPGHGDRLTQFPARPRTPAGHGDRLAWLTAGDPLIQHLPAEPRARPGFSIADFTARAPQQATVTGSRNFQPAAARQQVTVTGSRAFQPAGARQQVTVTGSRAFQPAGAHQHVTVTDSPASHEAGDMEKAPLDPYGGRARSALRGCTSWLQVARPGRKTATFGRNCPVILNQISARFSSGAAAGCHPACPRPAWSRWCSSSSPAASRPDPPRPRPGPGRSACPA